jgi:hypothetical protein
VAGTYRRLPPGPKEMTMEHPFSDEELLVLLEVARYALMDAVIFDDMAEQTDTSDAEMTKLTEKLNVFMEKKDEEGT